MASAANGPALPEIGDGAPAVAEAGRVESRDERDLQPEVQNDGDDHAADDRDGDVPPRPAALAAELDSLLEAEVCEHDAARRERDEHALPPVGHEAARGREVLPVRGGREQPDDYEGRHERA